jgi:Tol biopolymer transport system component
MSAAKRLESRLPQVLEDISGPRTPDYFDDILGQVGRTRQRPGWSFPERWLPMTALSERLATSPRIPMRMAVVLALLLLALAVSIVLIAGSQRPALPAPFGVASNGLIAFADDTGAILVGDVGTGISRVIVPGPGHQRPVYSPDGRRLAYLQAARQGGLDIVVSDSDGGSPVIINPKPINSIGHLGWTPASDQVVVVNSAGIMAFDPTTQAAGELLYQGSGVGSWEYLDSFNSNLTDIFRPPAGDEILFVGYGPKGNGLYRVPLHGGEMIAVYTDRTPSSGFSTLASPQWSPDGTRIAFTMHPPNDDTWGRAYIINADGTRLRRVSTFELEGYVIDEEHNSWSPDGTRIAFMRWLNDADGNTIVRPLVIVDVATGKETEAENVEVNGYGGWFWSPDGTSLLQVPGDRSEHVGEVLVVDATTGAMRRIGWSADFANGPSWQRTVPQS